MYLNPSGSRSCDPNVESACVENKMPGVYFSVGIITFSLDCEKENCVFFVVVFKGALQLCKI